MVTQAQINRTKKKIDTIFNKLVDYREKSRSCKTPKRSEAIRQKIGELEREKYTLENTLSSFEYELKQQQRAQFVEKLKVAKPFKAMHITHMSYDCRERLETLVTVTAKGIDFMSARGFKTGISFDAILDGRYSPDRDGLTGIHNELYFDIKSI